VEELDNRPETAVPDEREAVADVGCSGGHRCECDRLRKENENIPSPSPTQPRSDCAIWSDVCPAHRTEDGTVGRARRARRVGEQKTEDGQELVDCFPNNEAQSFNPPTQARSTKSEKRHAPFILHEYTVNAPLLGFSKFEHACALRIL
jgi:hypothetical protein